MVFPSSWSSSWGCSTFSGHVPDRDGSLGMYDVLLIKGVFSILSFHEVAASSPEPCSAPSGAPTSPSMECACLFGGEGQDSLLPSPPALSLKG